MAVPCAIHTCVMSASGACMCIAMTKLMPKLAELTWTTYLDDLPELYCRHDSK